VAPPPLPPAAAAAAEALALQLRGCALGAAATPSLASSALSVLCSDDVVELRRRHAAVVEGAGSAATAAQLSAAELAHCEAALDTYEALRAEHGRCRTAAAAAEAAGQTVLTTQLRSRQRELAAARRLQLPTVREVAARLALSCGVDAS